MHKPVFCLMGPTASGKTALACELVQRFPLEIISVDSALIYRDMTIGTAKPSSEELQQAPHHLIDILDPPESYSAAQFCQDAIKSIEAIYQRGHWPLLVGGTMMYFNALQQGLSSLPEADEPLRQRLLIEAEHRGWDHMHQQLALVDEEAAARIHPHDTQRIQRALEVFHLTGKPLSHFLAGEKQQSDYEFINLILFPERRAWLHERIATRFHLMLEAGLINEVQELLNKWSLPKSCPAMRTVGYRQAIDYLDGVYDYPTMIEKGIAATRQLAKRQLTWLRRWPHASYFDPESNDLTDALASIIQNHIY